MKDEVKISEILIELVEVFKTAMGDNIIIEITTQRAQLAEWDSLNHLKLIVELENKYNLGFSMEEIENLKSVKEIIDRLIKKSF
jgi:acyl carrier protein